MKTKQRAVKIHYNGNGCWGYDDLVKALREGWKRTVMLNYEVLANMYKSRKNHKLDEWHDFCDWVKALPYSELITGKE